MLRALAPLSHPVPRPVHNHVEVHACHQHRVSAGGVVAGALSQELRSGLQAHCAGDRAPAGWGGRLPGSIRSQVGSQKDCDPLQSYCCCPVASYPELCFAPQKSDSLQQDSWLVRCLHAASQSMARARMGLAEFRSRQRAVSVMPSFRQGQYKMTWIANVPQPCLALG